VIGVEGLICWVVDFGHVVCWSFVGVLSLVLEYLHNGFFSFSLFLCLQKHHHLFCSWLLLKIRRDFGNKVGVIKKIGEVVS